MKNKLLLIAGALFCVVCSFIFFSNARLPDNWQITEGTIIDRSDPRFEKYEHLFIGRREYRYDVAEYTVENELYALKFNSKRPEVSITNSEDSKPKDFSKVNIAYNTNDPAESKLFDPGFDYVISLACFLLASFCIYQAVKN